MKKIIPLILTLSLWGCGDTPQLEKIPVIKAGEMHAGVQGGVTTASTKKRTPEQLNKILVEILKYKNTPTLNFSNQMNTMYTVEKVTAWYAKNLQNLKDSDFDVLGKDNENLIQYMNDQANWSMFAMKVMENGSAGAKYNGKKLKDLIMDLR